MMKTPYIIALCTLVIAGCQKEDLVKQGNGDGTVRYAVAMNQTVDLRLQPRTRGRDGSKKYLQYTSTSGGITTINPAIPDDWTVIPDDEE